MRRFLLLGLAVAAPAIAQTPLCVWNGTSLTCPGQPAVHDPLAPAPQPGTLPAPAQWLEQLQAEAEFGRALIAERATQDIARVETMRRADSLIAAGNCADAETLVREKAPAEVPTVTSRCAAPPK